MYNELEQLKKIHRIQESMNHLEPDSEAYRRSQGLLKVLVNEYRGHKRIQADEYEKDVVMPSTKLRFMPRSADYKKFFEWFNLKCYMP